MQYTEHTVFERSAVLNHSPLVTYMSLKNINRMHKWHPFFYFDTPGPNAMENTYHDYFNNQDGGLITVTNFFNMLDGDIFLRELIFLHRRYGVSPVFNLSTMDRIHIDFEKVDDDENKTSITLRRKMLLLGSTDSDTNATKVQNAYSRTDAIYNALVDLEPSDDDGLLILKNKPAR